MAILVGTALGDDIQGTTGNTSLRFDSDNDGITDNRLHVFLSPGDALGAADFLFT